MGKFHNWYKDKLKVSRYPLPKEIELAKPDYVINVSDEYITGCHDICMENNIKYFWFPLTECNHNMGINSIFGALQILFIAFNDNHKVLLHCHASVNRSVTVAQSFFKMMTGLHIVENREENNNAIFKMFNVTDEQEKKDLQKMFKRNRVENNINAGHLPGIYNYNNFLKECKNYFMSYNVASGGLLDHIKIKSHITSY